MMLFVTIVMLQNFFAQMLVFIDASAVFVQIIYPSNAFFVAVLKRMVQSHHDPIQQHCGPFRYHHLENEHKTIENECVCTEMANGGFRSRELMKIKG